MTETIKILGQLSPGAATLSALYTVPAATQAVISTWTACNRSGTATTVRLSIALAGAADDVKQYIYFDLPLAGNDTFACTFGKSLGTTDVVRVQSANGLVSFSIFGSELS